MEEWLKDNDYFLVDIIFADGDRIVIEIDHADGVWIEDCAELSRFLQERLGDELGDYELEVGSAGLGQPFKVAQQYINQVQQSYVGHYGSSGGSGSGGGGGYGSGEYSDGHKGTEYSADEILNAYRQVKNAIGVALNSHNINYAIEALDKYSDYLTEDMAAEIQGLLDKYFPGQSQGGSWARARRGGMDVIN